MIRVLIADDSATLRSALVAMLAEDPELTVVGQAGDGLEAVSMARALRPDVITMDVNMPRLDGLGATAAIMADTTTPAGNNHALSSRRKRGARSRMSYGRSQLAAMRKRKNTAL